MYRMPEFKEDDIDAIAAFMETHPFITLIAADGGKIAATQVPVLVSREGDQISIRGHIMRKTDHHKTLEANQEALVLFTGPNCYVSASWYSERGTGSTWNYMTVQARGKVVFMTEEGTIQLLTDLTRKFETGQEQPQLVGDLTNDYVQMMVKAIVGFEMKLEDIKATFKLSQNRDDESYANIIRQLEKTGDAGALGIAEELKKRRNQESVVRNQ